MSIPGMEDHEFGAYFCKDCGVRMTYGDLCLDCKRKRSGKPAYTRSQRHNAELFHALKGLGLLFIVFPAAVILLLMLLNALGQ